MIAKLRSSEPGSYWHDGDVVMTSATPPITFEHRTSTPTYSPGLLGYSAAVSLRPSIASIYSTQSTATHSSVASAAPTVTEYDDEDTRVIRRLLLRKIDAQMGGAWEEIAKVAAWLKVLKEVVRGVKRRAYLS